MATTLRLPFRFPVGGIVTPPDLPTIYATLAINGLSQRAEGSGPAQYTAIAHYIDYSYDASNNVVETPITANVTNTATWTVEGVGATVVKGLLTIAPNNIIGDTRKITLVATFEGKTARWVVDVLDTSQPTGERLENVFLPVDANFDLVSQQNPPQPTISTIFSAPYQDTPQPPDYYGAMFNPAKVYQEFPKNQQWVLKEIHLDRWQGDLGTRPFLAHGVEADGTETLLLTFSPGEGGTVPPDVTPGKGRVYTVAPKAYVGIMWTVTGNAKPWYLRLFGDRTTAPLRGPVPVVKREAERFLATNIHPSFLLSGTQDPNVRDEASPDRLQLMADMGPPRVFVSMGSFTTSPEDFFFERDAQGFGQQRGFQQLHETTPGYSMAFENVPPDIYATYPDGGSYEKVPIPYGMSQTDPAAWTRYVDIVLQWTYRYGANPNVPSELVKSRTGYFFANDPRPEKSYYKRIGLGYCTRIEMIPNESDKYWLGIFSYLTPEGAATLTGILYPKIKLYNPGMICVLMGGATFAPDWTDNYVRACERMHGRDENGHIRLMCDELQVHFYPTTGGSQYSNEVTTGVAIEQSFGNVLWARFKDFLHYKWNPSLRVGISEIGQDATLRSPIRAVIPAGTSYTLREWAAVNYLRNSQWAARQGFEYVQHFNIEDVSPTNQDIQFSAMGAVHIEGTAPNAYLQPWPYLYLQGQWKAVAVGCKHVERLSSTPQVDKWQSATKTVYWLEMPTETNAAGSYTLDLPNGGTRYDFRFDSYTPDTTGIPAGSYTATIYEKGFALVPN